MAWFAIYETVGGKLISVATVIVDPLPAELTTKALADQPDFHGQVWNPTIEDFEVKEDEQAPPINFTQDFQAQPEVQALTAPQQVAVTDAFKRTLGIP